MLQKFIITIRPRVILSYQAFLQEFVRFNGFCGDVASPLFQYFVVKNSGKFYAYDFLTMLLKLYWPFLKKILMEEGFMGGVHPPLRSFLISDFVL